MDRAAATLDRRARGRAPVLRRGLAPGPPRFQDRPWPRSRRERRRPRRGAARGGGCVVVGLGGGQAGVGRGEDGARLLRRALEGAPMWIEGHQQLAQLLSTLGRADEVSQSLEQAIAMRPREPTLWAALLN